MIETISLLAAFTQQEYTLFEIRLTSDTITMMGDQHEALDQRLHGTVVLCVSKPLKLQSIQLQLIGRRRIAWVDTRTTAPGLFDQKVDSKNTILQHSWVIGSVESQQTLRPGNYEWPFEHTLPGNTPESIQGFYGTGVSYILKASISRGPLRTAYYTRKKLRILRTLMPTRLHEICSAGIERVWPEKMVYSIAASEPIVPIGGIIKLNMRFTPLQKDVVVNIVVIELIEVHDYRAEVRKGIFRDYQTQHRILKQQRAIENDCTWHDFIEGSGQEGWVVDWTVPLSGQTRSCSPDCETEGIVIHHRVNISVELKKSTGHSLVIKAALPICLFAPPETLHACDVQLITGRTCWLSTECSIEGAYYHSSPPTYEAHSSDPRYTGYLDIWPVRHVHRDGHSYSATDSSVQWTSRTVENVVSGTESEETTVTPGTRASASSQALDSTRLSQECSCCSTHRLQRLAPGAAQEPLDTAQLSRVPSYRTACTSLHHSANNYVREFSPVYNTTLNGV